MIELKSNVKYLEHELDSLTKMHEDMIFKWKQALIENENLEKEKQKVIQLYEHKLTIVREDCFKDEKQLRKDLAETKEAFDHFKNHVMREVKLSEEINKRHEGYQQVLKKELIMAKNIIKNPIMLKKASTDLNYDRLQLYKFRNIDEELQSKPPPKNIRSIQPIFVHNKSKDRMVSRRSLSINEKLSPKTNFSLRRELDLLNNNDKLHRLYNYTPQNMTLSSNFIKKKRSHFLSSPISEIHNQSIEYNNSKFLSTEQSM